MRFNLLAFVMVCTSLTHAQSDIKITSHQAKTADWLFTLATNANDSHFSISVMKEGWISFDQWNASGAFTATKVEVDPDTYKKINTEMTLLFDLTVCCAEESNQTASALSHTFEKIDGTTSTSITFSGPDSYLLHFLQKTMKRLKLQSPFPLIMTVKTTAESEEQQALKVLNQPDWSSPNRHQWTLDYHTINGMERDQAWHIRGTDLWVRLHPESRNKLEDLDTAHAYEIDATAVDQSYGVIDFYVYNIRKVPVE